MRRNGRDERYVARHMQIVRRLGPPDPIKIGAHQIVYALRVLGCEPKSEAMQAGYKVLDQHRLENRRYVLTASKSVPAFKAGNVGEENKWVTLYAYMAR